MGEVMRGWWLVVLLLAGCEGGRFQLPRGQHTDKPIANDTGETAESGAPRPDTDEDCVELTWFRDADGDGHGNAAVTKQACAQPVGFVGVADDCDDTDADRHPGAAERCDEEDDDCDGVVDDGAKTVFYPDKDGDGYGGSTGATEACEAPYGYVATGGDCDDGRAAAHPGATETCNDRDDDCDGAADEGVTSGRTWYRDADADGWGDPDVTKDSCARPTGYVSNFNDCDDTTSAVSPSATESCDGVDDDCDGAVDEAPKTTWFYDADGDGYGTPAKTYYAACTPPEGYVAYSTDCDDADATVSPADPEVCGDGEDDDCDGTIDEGC